MMKKGLVQYVVCDLCCFFSQLTDDVHWMTSRQLSPSPATNLNHSPASLSLHNSCSKDSSFFESDESDCRFTRFVAEAAMDKRKVNKCLVKKNSTRVL